jgi:hypothetical protein
MDKAFVLSMRLLGFLVLLSCHEVKDCIQTMCRRNKGCIEPISCNCEACLQADVDVMVI